MWDGHPQQHSRELIRVSSFWDTIILSSWSRCQKQVRWIILYTCLFLSPTKDTTTFRYLQHTTAGIWQNRCHYYSAINAVYHGQKLINFLKAHYQQTKGKKKSCIQVSSEQSQYTRIMKQQCCKEPRVLGCVWFIDKNRTPSEIHWKVSVARLCHREMLTSEDVNIQVVVQVKDNFPACFLSCL